MDADILIIGSGMGGATLAAALAPTGARIVILERGERLQPSPATRDPFSVFKFGTFRSGETWETPEGKPFDPGNYYMVGGNSKFYGAVMFRYRREDFGELSHLGGTSPAWPVDYDTFAPWYRAAEDMYEVRGARGVDPTDPDDTPYPHPPVPHEPDIAHAASRLAARDLTPAPLPLAVDLNAWLAEGRTGWDGYPNTGSGKKDAESVGIAKALAHSNVTLETGCEVTRLVADASGQITEVRYAKNGAGHTATSRLVILSAGAVQSAALLLKSANDNFPTGLANGSDQVGRNFMNHNCSAMMALHPLRKVSTLYQKTLYLNDFYLSGEQSSTPLGNIQLLGKITPEILRCVSPLPAPLASWIARRSVDWYLMSEDLPTPDSRVTVKGDRIVLDWKRTNLDAHSMLVKTFRSALKKAGYPIVLSQAFDRSTPSHQCGTVRFGQDPRTAPLDLTCRAHQHPNLYVVDASFLPCSAAVNPALTIAANALRVADHIAKTELAA
ncbi:FAD-dependent oxidoreductase [Tropicimonas sp. S265A]|uniref:FAD-dependent oxidoreductase n=1 Tax=Tropicimonas sp. S265A TaxID=3415134 RepID=UPI003C7D7950